ncbi:MAG: phosphoribosylanthranilate isomerase [Thiohalobacterales bacterium]|nr:phosphoribosylanthranilate isomerase [Thiohalobacterales bacterium]
MRTRVKICGITRVEDAQAASAAGADAIGLVFYAASPRHVEIPQALEICSVLPPFVSVVGLFVDAAREQVKAVISELPLDLLQFHGSEDSTACEGFGRPYMKAIGMKPGVNPGAIMQLHPRASGFLLDAYQPDTHGGGGLAFDWDSFPEAGDRPLVLAGGLVPDNVALAIEQTRPYAVDVSSGVEKVKGIKSAEKIEAFMRGVERGDANRARS